MLLMLLALVGCGPAWEVVATELPGGVMLAATTLGDEMVVSGGVYEETGSLWRYDGDSICVEEGVADAALWWVQGRSASDWYAVGERGVVIHEVDGTRTQEDLPVEITLFGVYDDGESAWIVGGDVRGDQTGQIWRKEDGGDWAKVADTPGLAFKVHEGWVVGDGFVWEWDGSDFVDRTPEGAPRLLTVRVVGNDVYAVGGLVSAEFWHWTGDAWEEPTLTPACVGQPLNGVYAEEGDDVWLTGNFGTASSWDGESFACADFPITSEHFHAVWRFGEEILAVGGNLFAQTGQYGTIARFGSSRPLDVGGACAE